MKKYIGVIAVLISMSFTPANAQFDSLRNVLKIGGHYQILGLEGKRTEAAAWGLSYERKTGYFTSWTLDIAFIERVEQVEELEKNVPQYNDIFQIKVGFRRYFDQSLKGIFVGGAVAMGIPKENGMSWELDGNFGYQLRHNRLSVEFMADIGIGSMRFQEDQYYNGILVSQEKFYGVGFLFRPMLRMGFAL